MQYTLKNGKIYNSMKIIVYILDLLTIIQTCSLPNYLLNCLKKQINAYKSKPYLLLILSSIIIIRSNLD